jgi:hypothetical protein
MPESMFVLGLVGYPTLTSHRQSLTTTCVNTYV